VTIGQTVLKQHARKLRRLYQGKVLAGFAGATADAFTLFEKFEQKLEAMNGSLRRAAVALAKDWRTDRVLRRLEALLVVADAESTLGIPAANTTMLTPPGQDPTTSAGSNSKASPPRAGRRLYPNMPRETDHAVAAGWQ